LVLQGYTAGDDVAFGAVVSGRPAEIENVETMVGLFINTIPVRIWCKDRNLSFSQFVQQVQMDAVVAKSHEYTPLAEIQAQTELKNTLLDHVLAFQNFPIQTQEKSSENSSEQSSNQPAFSIANVQSFEHNNYNFTIIVSQQDETYVRYLFNSDYFDTDFIKGLADTMARVIEQIATQPDIKLKDIVITSNLQEANSNVSSDEFKDFGF
jgi:iturin family lipopeptide synthetase B